MFCPKCGAKNPDGAKFCGACGEPFRSAPAPAPAAAPASAAPGAAPTTFPQAAPTTGKTLPKKTIAIVAGAVVVVVAVVAVALTLFGGGKPFEGTIEIGGDGEIVITDTSVTARGANAWSNSSLMSGTIEETRRENGGTVYELSNIESPDSSFESAVDAGVEINTTICIPDGAARGNAAGEWSVVMDMQGGGQNGIMVFWADVQDDGTVQIVLHATSAVDKAAIELLDPLSDDFDPEAYFADSFGVTVDEDCSVERVRVRVQGVQRQYLRTLPLHASQKEVETAEDASVFEFYLRPTLDFQQELLTHAVNAEEDIEVLEPQWLREHMQAIGQVLYQNHQNK